MTHESLPTLEDALVHAVWRQDRVEVQRLLQMGADPNVPGRAWSSAIACAGENDETGDLIRILVAAGADVNRQNEQGQTPLHHAVDVAIVGAIQQDRDFFDWTVVGVLLDLGANPQLPDGRGKTVADVASAYGSNARSSWDEFMASRQ